jgi:Ca2+/Na+ antiporter
MIPALILSVYIRMCTKITQPPERLIFIYAIIGFVMSILWISFTCNIVIDLLSVLGVMLNLPKTLLGLTLLAWGNCLGDMNANVAMTKKGFGEMAITGCMAGPVFNVLMGLGLSTLGSLSNDVSSSIPFSFYKKDKLNKNAVLAAALIISEIGALSLIGFNALGNQYHIAKPFALVNVLVYGCVISALVVFTLV